MSSVKKVKIGNNTYDIDATTVDDKSVTTTAPSSTSDDTTIPTSKAVYNAIASVTESVNLCPNKWVYGLVDAFGQWVAPDNKANAHSECAIPVEPNTKYTIKVYGINLASIRASYYTKPNYNYPAEGVIQSFISDSFVDIGRPLEFTTASNCYRLMITVSGLIGSTADIPINAIKCMLIKGSASDLPSNYIEYKKNGTNINKDKYTLWHNCIDGANISYSGLGYVGSFNQNGTYKDIDGSNPLLAGLNKLVIKYVPYYNEIGNEQVEYKKFDLPLMVNNTLVWEGTMTPRFFLSEKAMINQADNIWREFSIKIYTDFSIGLKFDKAWDNKTTSSNESMFCPVEIYAIYEDD